MQLQLQLSAGLLLVACARSPSVEVHYDPPLPDTSKCYQRQVFTREAFDAAVAGLKPQADGLWDQGLTPGGCFRIRRTFEGGKAGPVEAAYGYDWTGGPFSLSIALPEHGPYRPKFGPDAQY